MTDDLFRNRLENMINPRHGLVKLAGIMPWEKVCKAVESYIPSVAPSGKAKGSGLFGEVVLAGKASNAGHPPLPPRLLVGLHYLKHAYDCSDDEVVERWAENPYWQFFTGEEFFQTKLPCDSSSLTHWRQRIWRRRCRRNAGGDHFGGQGTQDRQGSRPAESHHLHHGAGDGDCLSDRQPADREIPGSAGQGGRREPTHPAAELQTGSHRHWPVRPDAMPMLGNTS